MPLHVEEASCICAGDWVGDGLCDCTPNFLDVLQGPSLWVSLAQRILLHMPPFIVPWLSLEWR